MFICTKVIHITKIMVNCSAYGCNSDSRKKMPSITFHRFPVNQEICSAWLKNMKLHDWTPTKNSRLCSKHFEERFLYKTDLKVKLLNLAVPTIFSDLPMYLQQKPQRKKKWLHLKTPEPNSTAPNIHVETSINVRLKNKLRLVELRSKEKSRKIRVLSQSLKRCRKKIQTLKQFIKTLRSKKMISHENLNALPSFTTELLLEKNGKSDKCSEELKDFDTINVDEELNCVQLYVEDCPTDTYFVSLN